MKAMEERMGGYAAYHQDKRCQATHLFGVPMVFYSPLIPMAWLRLDVAGFEVSLAMVLLAAVLIWYIALDRGLGIIMTMISIPVLYATETIARLPFEWSLGIFLAIKISGWVIQLIGHAFEGRRPALVDNLIQSLMGPLFVLAEVLFALGFRKDLEKAVQERVARHAFSSEGKTKAA